MRQKQFALIGAALLVVLGQPDIAAAQSPPLSLAQLPLRFFGNVALRYDYSKTNDITDQLVDDLTGNGLRLRVRFGVEYGNFKTDAVIGGIRFSTGENPNPTVPFVALADAFRPASFALDQAWFAIRPLVDRDRVSLTLGRMPNPAWRGSAGTLRTELIWDNDVSPAGLALRVVLWKSTGEKPAFKVENLVAYYQIQEILDLRFSGLSGVSNVLTDQLKIASRYVDGAVAFYDWENLNNGLSAPGHGAGGVSAQTPQAPFLLRPGLQLTNNIVARGPGAAVGFTSDAFRVVNPTVQLHVPFAAARAGDPDVYLLVDYAHNLSVRRDGDGVGATVGVRLGDYQGALHPLNAWVTYRYVQADATPAAFADSDLGGGTGYKGFAAGINYRFRKELLGQISYFDFMGFPLMENHVQRLFLDLMAEF